MKLTVSKDQMTATAPDGTELVFAPYGHREDGSEIRPDPSGDWCRGCFAADKRGGIFCGVGADANLCSESWRQDRDCGRWLKKEETPK